MFRRYIEHLYQAAESVNRRNIEVMLRDQSHIALCDLDCDDGRWTMDLASLAKSRLICGVEIVPERARSAKA